MRSPNEMKDDLLVALNRVLDEPLRSVGFARPERSLVYKRKLNSAVHQITFRIHSRPKYEPGAEAHIYPSFQVLMKQVSDQALSLVKGDKFLPGGASDFIVRQPLEFVAPKDRHERWFATGTQQFVICCEKIKAFIFQWVLPFLSEVSRPSDLVELDETEDERVVKGSVWRIYVAAAYMIGNEPEKARDLILRHLGKPGLKKRYRAVFESLHID